MASGQRKGRAGSSGANAGPRPEGQVRRSQVLSTFGPGALVDFPKHAAIMGGVESWGDPDRDRFQQIHEERLEVRLREREQNPTLRLFAPPSSQASRDPAEASGRGITAFEFPEWFVEQPVDAWVGEGGFRSRRLLHRRAIERAPHGPVVPIRFVQACPNGHVSDIDWKVFAHHGATDCTRELFIDERGTSGDLADILVRCACKKSRSLVDATQRGESSALGPCWGETPWLGGGAGDKAAPCLDAHGKPHRSRLLVRSATSAYFPQSVSAISIPASPGKQPVRAAVEEAWADLESAEGPEDIARELRKAKYKHLRERWSAEELWAEVTRRRAGGGAGESARGLKAAELETFLSVKTSEVEGTPHEEDFLADAVALDPGRRGPMRRVARVVLVHRMREVVVQIGFTRFEAPVRDVDDELSLGVRTAQLAREVTWLPAVENRGEGIFISLDPEAVLRWRERRAVQDREAEIIAGFEAWRRRRGADKARFAGVTYVMLHSLSHLLLTAVSLECGYAASSIRERIYLGENGRTGILLFTGTPDAEGTLGGLVQVGKRLERHLEAALALGRLCSNDPVCAQHHPNNPHEERFLHGAACHGCLLVSEPSCEWSNELLDRSLVVETVEGHGAAFFEEG